MSSIAAAVAMIGIPSGSSWFPNQWSPLPWVFMAWTIGLRCGHRLHLIQHGSGEREVEQRVDEQRAAI